MQFEFPIRVYYEDTDTGGIVFYANYLKFFERARTEWLRSGRAAGRTAGRNAGSDRDAVRVPGISQQQVADELGLIFVVRSTAVDYKRPARLDDVIRVVSRVERLGRVGIDFYQEALIDSSANGNGVLLAAGRIKVGCVTRDGLRPMPIPESVRLIFAPVEASAA
ncbi:MAG: thioesterase family protein [Burkholderiaceae bacterium]